MLNFVSRTLLPIYGLFLVVIIVMADTSWGVQVWSWIHDLPGGDKLGHFLLFGTLSFLVNLSVAQSKRFRRFRWRHLWATLAVCLAVLLEECSQLFLASRNFDGLDILADLAGIFLFAGVACIFVNSCLPRRAGARCSH